MAERDIKIPPVGDLLGLPLPSEELQRPQTRGDLLDYYLGPTGIPDRLQAANEVLNPVRGVSDAMYYSGQAFDPSLSGSERRSAAGRAAMETGIAMLPVGLAKVAGRYARGMPADDAQAVVETMTGATPDLQDPARRKFLAGMGATAIAPLLPAEELLATGTRATARGAGSSALGAMLEKLNQHNAMERTLSESLRPLDRAVAAAGRRDLPDILMTPEKAQALQAADEAMAQRKEIISTLAGNTEGRKGVLNDITDLLANDAEAFKELDPNMAPSVFETLVERASQRQGAMGSLDAQEDVLAALEVGTEALEELGLTKPEADLAMRLAPTISDLYR